MKAPRSFTLQTLVVALLCNAALVAAALAFGGEALAGRLLPLLVVAIVAALLLWFFVSWRAGALLDGAAPASAPPARPTAPAPAPTAATDASALHLLSILQRKGRLIDFLHEDLTAYDDAQIGAAVRSVHEGCKQALDEYVSLEPIYAEPEGSTVTVGAGFDRHAVRLTGHVAGDPPFKGALRHAGWRAAAVTLPARTADADAERILAPAEVEVG